MNIDKLIGNTPMIKIKFKYQNRITNIYAKLEYYNYTGSIKDRLANYIIKESYKKGMLSEGMPIIEATSGNTGISFSALGALYGHPVHIFMPDWVSSERIKIMNLYGANVHLVSREDGGFCEAIKRADDLSMKIGGFRPDQFNNDMNVEAHYYGIGAEIINTLDKIDVFVSGIGTGGTLIGTAKKIKEKFPDVVIVALEPKQLPILSEGINTGNHKIEGIGDDFIPSIVDKSIIDIIVTIDDNDAINMSRILAKKIGLGVGISSGANVLASILSGKENVVTVFADDFKKYLSTDISDNISDDKNMISNEVEIIDVEYI